MSHFLANIINRHLGVAEVVRPRPRSLFEPESVGSVNPYPGYDLNPLQKSQREQRDDREVNAQESAPLNQPEAVQKATKLKNSPATEPDANRGEGRNTVEKRAIPPITTSIRPSGPEFPADKTRITPLKNPDRPVAPESGWSTPVVGSGDLTKDAGLRQTTTNVKLKHPVFTPLPAERKPVVLPNLTAKKSDEEGQPGGIFNRIGNIHPVRELALKNQLAEPEPTTISVHIGRIEVKAADPLPETRQSAAEPRQPELSLDQFLQKREGTS